MMMRFLALLLLVTPANAAQPADIAVALTDDLVEIDTGFSGAELTLFGAVTGVDDPQGKVDIISVVRGPETDFNIRRIVKHNLIWTPGAPHTVKGAPGLYLTNATRRRTASGSTHCRSAPADENTAQPTRARAGSLQKPF